MNNTPPQIIAEGFGPLCIIIFTISEYLIKPFREGEDRRTRRRDMLFSSWALLKSWICSNTSFGLQGLNWSSNVRCWFVSFCRCAFKASAKAELAGPIFRVRSDNRIESEI